MRFGRNWGLGGRAGRLAEERAYELVMAEMETGYVRMGLWGKALAETEGDHARAKALYIKLRVQALMDEVEEVADTGTARSSGTGQRHERPARKRHEFGESEAEHVNEIVRLARGGRSHAEISQMLNHSGVGCPVPGASAWTPERVARIVRTNGARR
jgi:hypothetical protein